MDKTGRDFIDEMKDVYTIRDILMNLIEDLKKRDMLETKRTKHENEAINAILLNANNFTETVSGMANQLGYQGLTPEQFDKIPTKGQKFAFLIVAISNYNLQIENFKNLMLYLLKWNKQINHKTTLGKLMWTLIEVSEEYSTELDKRVSVEFRNAFAHSRFWITEHEICYVLGNDFSKYKAIRQTDFLNHARFQNMMTKCLGDIIREYYPPSVE